METAARIRTQPRPKCFLCGHLGELLHDNLTDFHFSAPGSWTLKKCSNPDCGTAWLDPFPLTEDLHLAYQTYYTHVAEGDDGCKSSGVRDSLYKLYRAVSSIPGTILGLNAEKRELARMLLGESNGGRLLDVGCGDGEFLNRMRNEGWSVDGVDFDRQAIENANRKYGMKLQCGSITTPGFAEASFDAITLYHVIEHVPDPLEVFFECHRLLKPGGCLVMATPNAESLGHRTFGNCWRGLEPPRHLQLFSPRTLAECARRARLEVVRAYSTAANADVIAGASLSIQENPAHRSSLRPAPSLGRTLKAMVFQYREHLLLKRQPGAGEEAVLDCRKKDG